MKMYQLIFLLLPISSLGQDNFKVCDTSLKFTDVDVFTYDFSNYSKSDFKKYRKENNKIYYNKSEKYINKRLEIPKFSESEIELQSYFRNSFEIKDSLKYTMQYHLTFIVNCIGEIGQLKWRTEPDMNSQQLGSIAENMRLWIPATYKKLPIDYYVTIHFRIKNNILTVFYRNKDDLFEN
jgi:hypothetical protein